MSHYDVPTIIFRWLHISGAIMAAGGAIFAAFVVLPVISGLAPDIRANVQELVRRRFALLLHFAITLLIISGIYNVIPRLAAHKGQTEYHAILGIKLVLALIVFFFSIVLTGKSPAFEKMRKRRKRYMTLNILFALIIVGLSAILRGIPEVH